MSEHLPPRIVKGYLERSLSAAELISVSDHLAACMKCRDLILDRQNLDRSVSLLQDELDESLASSHVTYSQLEAFVDGKSDPTDHGALLFHFEECSWCAEELRELSLVKQELVNLQGAKASERTGLLKSIANWRLVLRVALPALAFVGVIAFIWLSLNKERGHKLDLGRGGNHPPLTNPDQISSTSAHSSPNTNGEQYAFLSPQFQSVVVGTIASRRLQVPIQIDSHAALLRGFPNVFLPVSPVETVVFNVQPTFHWSALPDADAYVVHIYDSSMALVESSSSLDSNAWISTVALTPGRIYVWFVNPVKNGQEVREEFTQQSAPRFKILERAERTKLEQVRHFKPQDHLVLGILFAHAGVLDEAADEFQKVPKSDPNFSLAVKLLRQIPRPSTRRLRPPISGSNSQ